MADKGKPRFLTKAKKTVARANQNIMAKFGKAEQTVDISFNQEKERFQDHYKAVKKLNKDVHKLLEILRDLSIQQSVVAEGFYEMYESSADLYNAALKQQDTMKSIETARVQFEEQMRNDFLNPLSSYQGEFKEMSNRIDLRNTRRVDMDRYHREVRSAQEKFNKAKLETAQAKFTAAKTNYDALNVELLDDLPRLYADRIPFFDPLLATYLTGMSEYYRTSSRFMSEVVEYVSHVNRQSIHDHQRVTTETAASAASREEKPDIRLSPQTSPVGTTTGSPQQYQPPSGGYNQPPMSAPMSAPPPSNPIPSNPPPTSGQVLAKGVYDFNAQDPSELGFKAGDVITVISQNGEWWEGELNGKRGLLPSNYVSLLN